MIRWKQVTFLVVLILLGPAMHGAVSEAMQMKGKGEDAKKIRGDNRRFGSIFNNDLDNILHAVDSKQSTEMILADYRRALGEILESKPGILAQNVGMPDPVIYRSAMATPGSLWH